jgi:hypothetical protein
MSNGEPSGTFLTTDVAQEPKGFHFIILFTFTFTITFTFTTSYFRLPTISQPAIQSTFEKLV